MKKHIFRRIFILYFIVLSLSIAFIEIYITKVIRSDYLANLQSHLSVQIDLISNNISFSASEQLDTLCAQFKKTTGARITVIDSKGTVLGDSENSSFLMENLSDRPEIQQALLSGTASSIRHSNTINDDLLYVAKKIMDGNEHSGFIRLALPVRVIDEAINHMRLKINLVVILMLLIIGATLIWHIKRIRKIVHQIADYSGALAHGLFRKRLSITDSGEFTEIAESLNEISSELKINVNRVNEESNRLNVILKNIPDALLLINKDHIIEMSNSKARELFGNPLLEGKPVTEVLGSSVFISLVKETEHSRMPASGELTVDVPEERYLLVRLSPLFYKVGEFSGTVAIFHDITDFRKLEQMRTDFVANVSHEIKTPITAIKGFAETLLDGALHDTSNAEKFLETIKTHSERLNRLVEDLLTLSRIELKVIKINKTKVNIVEIIDNVTQMMLVRIAEKDLEIKTSVKDLKPIISADRDRIEQILLNLLDNAIKFSERGIIEIGISDDNGRTYIYVSDRGIGIPQKFVSRIGERFFRVDASRSRELGGTGLGLAIVKHLVMAHGWEMKVESQVQTGTTVKIYI
jgi:two-component system phosphate regulon sensor histidine kinase PhoR